MKKIITVVAVLIFIAFCFYIVFIHKIKNIRCESQFGPCSPHISHNFTQATEKGLLKSKSEVRKLLSENSYVGDFAIQYSFPSSLEVRILERKGYVAVANSLDSEYEIWDRSGNILEISTDTVLPKLLLYEPEKLSREQILFASDILSVLFRWKDIKVAHVSLEGIKIDLDSSNRLLLPLEGDKDVLMGSVRYILSWLNTNPQGSRIEIDLRYKNPVIRKTYE